ncbi:MjaI family restriction endonuclease [Bacteroides sp. 224]|uniref:MjaI family restriction endonuclease n=1 Tax=Bacteroides sp. 224 TaxID=2302936 RepID=UPI0013D43E51|nr:MjaI family restriction endonuclease [Bacteroides sp. 224]NDV66165.1 MjaI family restriction endonuclease [Bacteroides sp. 224]
MSKKEIKRYSLEFGKKEKVLNYACQTYQLSRPNKVGAVMALIRECQPQTIEQWEKWYFDNASTTGKQPFKITKESLFELGERLYTKITEVVIPEWKEAFSKLTKEDCVNYIYNLTINRTFDGYLREKSVVNDGLAKRFPDIRFEESPSELDHAGDIDYLGYVSDDIAFGIQIKPVTSKANFGNYSASERMKDSFEAFKNEFGGNVFIVYSLDGEIANENIFEVIELEIQHLINKK